LEGPTCSNTGERGRWEDTSDGDSDGRGDLDGTGGGVLVSLGEGLPSVEGERERLVSLLSSIDGKRGQAEQTLSEGREGKRNVR
jgi:hypothetical protein